MSETVLIQVAPRVPATGRPVPIRLAGGGTRRYDHLGYRDWRAGVANLPRITVEVPFDAAGFTGAAIPQAAGIQFQTSDPVLANDLANLYWRDAPVTITTVDDEARAPVYVTRLVGTVAKASFDGLTVSFTIGDLAALLNKPLVSSYFAGTGGLEGPADVGQRLKRRSIGIVFNIEGRLLDRANSIYEFSDPGRPLRAFRALKDKGRVGGMVALDWQGTAEATLAALQAAPAPKGGGVVAASIACAKWWTTPAGPLTADLEGEIGGGYVDQPGAIAIKLAAEVGIIAEDAAQANVRLFDGGAGIHIESASDTGANALDRLCLGVSLIWSLTPASRLRLSPWQIVTDAITPTAWTAGNVAPIVWTAGGVTPSTWEPGGPIEDLISLDVSRVDVFAPAPTRRLGYSRNYRVHTDAEIAASLTPASDTAYDDGTLVQSLQPAAAGADVTAANMAASIKNQGTGATASTLAALDQVAAQALYDAGQAAENARIAAEEARAIADGAQTGQAQTIPYGSTLDRALIAGAALNLAGYISVAGGPNGTIKALIKGGETGAAAATIATGSPVAVTPGEPADASVTTTFTNTTGATKSFTFFVEVARTPTTAGGAINAAGSYLYA